MPLSDKLRAAVKLAKPRQYQLAHKIRVHPSQLSGWLNGIIEPAVGDPRIEALGRLVKVRPEECFATNSSEEQSEGKEPSPVG